MSLSICPLGRLNSAGNLIPPVNCSWNFQIVSIWHQVVGNCKTEASAKPFPMDNYMAEDLLRWPLRLRELRSLADPGIFRVQAWTTAVATRHAPVANKDWSIGKNLWVSFRQPRRSAAPIVLQSLFVRSQCSSGYFHGKGIDSISPRADTGPDHSADVILINGGPYGIDLLIEKLLEVFIVTASDGRSKPKSRRRNSSIGSIVDSDLRNLSRFRSCP